MTAVPLRAVFVIQKLFGLTGGAERVFVETARGLAARGIDVKIMIFDNGHGVPAYDVANLNVINLFPRAGVRAPTTPASGNATPGFLKSIPHNAPLLGHIKWQLTHGVFVNRLRRALAADQPDIVIAFLPPAIGAAVRAAKPLNIPVIASTHNVPERDFGASDRWDQNPVYRKRARAALHDAAAVTVLNDSFRSWFAPEAQDQIHVLPNAVQRVSPQPTTLPQREKMILGVGRLTAIKRYDLLLSAWVHLRSEFPDWRVKIYGEGPERQALSDQIKAAQLDDVVQLCGVTPDIGAVYDHASLLCHPSAFEGFGLSVAEAMAHGVPVIGFQECTGINQLLQTGQNGWLIDETDDPIATLTQTIRYAILNPQERLRLGAQATAISQIYSIDKNLDIWETLLRSSLGSKAVQRGQT